MCCHSNDSRLPVKKDDSYYTVINAYDIYLVATRQLKLRGEQETLRKPPDTSIPATGRDSIPAFLQTGIKLAYLFVNFSKQRHILDRTNWLKNKMYRHLDDGSYLLRNSTDSCYAVKIRPIRIITKVMIQKRGIIASIKLCRQIDDSSHYLDKNGNNYSKNNYVFYNQINWLENKMCHLADYSCHSPGIYIHYIGDGFYTVDNKTHKVILVIETATFLQHCASLISSLSIGFLSKCLYTCMYRYSFSL